MSIRYCLWSRSRLCKQYCSKLDGTRGAHNSATPHWNWHSVVTDEKRLHACKWNNEYWPLYEYSHRRAVALFYAKPSSSRVVGLHLRYLQYPDYVADYFQHLVSSSLFHDQLTTLAVSSGKHNVTVRLSVHLSRRRILSVSYQVAALDAASVHVRPSITRTNILVHLNFTKTHP